MEGIDVVLELLFHGLEKYGWNSAKTLTLRTCSHNGTAACALFEASTTAAKLGPEIRGTILVKPKLL